MTLEEIRVFVHYSVSAGNLTPIDWATLEAMIEAYAAAQVP